jgi:hypothetical protein
MISSNVSMCRVLFVFWLLTFLSVKVIRCQTNDFRIWSSAGVEKQLDNWSLAAEASFRTRNNAAEVNRLDIGLEAAYRICKQLKGGSGYQFIYYNDAKYSDFQPRHRFYIYLTGKQELGNFVCQIRERIQLTTKDESDRIKDNGETDVYSINPEITWRNRLKLAYNIPKFPLDPAISLESFYLLNNPDGNTFSKLRYEISLDYKLSRHHVLNLYGLIDKLINTDNPVRYVVVGIGYTYSF